jgi:transposase
VLGGLLGLPEGLRVEQVEREADGSLTVHVVAAAGPVVCCPGCGRASGRVKETVGHTVRHLVVAPMRVTWHKRRLTCENAACSRGGFVEDAPLAVRGGRVSVRGLETMGHLVGDWGVPVSRVAAVLDVSWHTAHGGLALVAGAAGIVATDPALPAGDPGAADVGDADGAAAADDAVAEDDPGREAADPRPRRSVSGPLPPVDVLGIDDHRRGRPRWHRNPLTGRWVEDADRWATGFIDSAGGHGLLGQVEGRTAAATAAWIRSQPAAWRDAIRAVTIDMSTVYKSAARAALPHAIVAVDPFHVVQLGNKVVGDVRRRVIHEHYGRRGRADDPEYAIKGLLVRNDEKLSDAARGRLLCTLADLGEHGFPLGTARRAKELLRDVLKLSPTRTTRATTRTDIDRALTRFFEYCGTVGHTVPEIVTLAETISTWRVEVANAVLHGLSNAAAEGVNRLTKLIYRIAFGLRNVTNQQLRARYFASRSTRPGWLQPVTAHPAAV